MTPTFRMIAATFALFLVSSAVLCAQSDAMPDAPTPTKSIGLNLTLPPAHVRPSPASPIAASFCGGNIEGLFAPNKNGVPDGQMNLANAYSKSLSSLILRNWAQHIAPHTSSLPMVRLRFVIFPDGTASTPEITESSPDPRDDARALAAVHDVSPFPALPEGFDKPVAACLRFGGHSIRADTMYLEEDEPAPSPTPSPVEKQASNTCGGRPDGVYASANHYRLKPGDAADHEFLHRVEARLQANMDPIELREAGRGLGPDGYIRVRFAIRPDGTYFPPEITHSAGNAAGDEILLGAVRRVQSFPQLPPDKTVPLVVCLSFHYDPASRSLRPGKPKGTVDSEP